MSEQNQGSFLGGLALGLFAGAAGFFWFGTKNGAEMRKKLEQEWTNAKEAMAKEGVIKNKDASLSQLIGEWLGMAEAKTPTKKKTTKNSSTSKSSKFKGV